jgi:hypothetical protein
LQLPGQIISVALENWISRFVSNPFPRGRIA